MKYKILIFALALFLLINTVSAIDSSNWTTATVGYENFKIPPEYENPYSSDFNMYEYDYDIDVSDCENVNIIIIFIHIKIAAVWVFVFRRYLEVLIAHRCCCPVR